MNHPDNFSVRTAVAEADKGLGQGGRVELNATGKADANDVRGVGATVGLHFPPDKLYAFDAQDQSCTRTAPEPRLRIGKPVHA